MDEHRTPLQRLVVVVVLVLVLVLVLVAMWYRYLGDQHVLSKAGPGRSKRSTLS